MKKEIQNARKYMQVFCDTRIEQEILNTSLSDPLVFCIETYQKIKDRLKHLILAERLPLMELNISLAATSTNLKKAQNI